MVYDAAQSKQNKVMPGSHISKLDPKELFNNRPDYILILPSNLATEVKNNFSYLAEKGTKFVTAVSKLEIFR